MVAMAKVIGMVEQLQTKRIGGGKEGLSNYKYTRIQQISKVPIEVHVHVHVHVGAKQNN